jgi:hypothetical protein
MDGMEDDGRSRAASAFCGGGVPAGEAVGGFMRGVRGLPSDGIPLIRKAQSSKKVQLNVDSVSHWMATNNARDNLTKRDYFNRFGVAEGLRRLAEDHPFRPHLLAVHH